MIGTIGFTIGALTIGLFAATSYRAYRLVELRKLQLFSTAFGLFAAAMVFWAVAAASTDSAVVQRMLFASDTVLLIGTLGLVATFVSRVSVLLNVSLGVVGAVALSLRAFQYLPTGYVHDGLLYFNLSGGVRTVILLAFVVIWLPAMIQIAQDIARDPLLPGVGGSLSACFVALVFVSVLFLSARRSSVIITLFVFIAALFLVMSILNLLIIRLHKMSPPAKKGKASHHAPA